MPTASSVPAAAKSGMRKDVELLVPDLHHGGPLAVGIRSCGPQEREAESLIEVQAPVHVRDLETNMIETLQPQHERLSL
jgi:hypothetical protein